MKTKRIIVTLLIAAIMATQLFAPVVFADRDDAKYALDQLKGLLEEDRVLILRYLWDYAAKEVADGKEVSVESVFNAIYESLTKVGKQGLIRIKEEDPTEKTIEKSSVEILIQKILNNKEIIVDYYNIYKQYFDKTEVKLLLGLDENASAGEVYTEMLKYLVPVLKLENEQFKRNDDVSSAIARKLGVKQDTFKILLGDINSKIDELAGKIENNITQYGLTRQDVIDALEIYDLFEEDPSSPRVVSTSPSSGATGISTGASIKITFSKNIYEGESSTYGNITLKAGSTALAIDKSISGDTLTIVPKSTLAYSTTYTVNVPAGAVTDEVMRPADGITFSFTTGSGSPSTPPSGPSGEEPAEKPETPAEPSEEEKEVKEIIDGIDEEAIETVKGEELEKLVKELTESLGKASELIASIDKPQTAMELAKALIEKIAPVIQKLEEEGKALAADEFAVNLNNVANAVLKLVATIKSEPTIEAGAVKAQIELGEVAEGELVDAATRQKLKDIAAMAQELKTMLQNNGVESRIKPALYINAATSTEGVESANVSIPSGLLLAMIEEGIEEVVLTTDIATMNIPANAVKLEKDDNMEIINEKVDNEQLPASAKAAVGDAPVYNLAISVNGKKAEFKGKVKVTIPYTLKAADDPEKITVFYINDEGQLVNVIGVYDEKTGTVSFDAEHFSNYTIKENDIRFKDVGSKYWASRYIEVMASKGVIKGVGAELFKPTNNVTRADFVAMIVRAFKLFDETATNPFKDVKETDWFYPEVVAGAKAGIIKGRPGGIFAPNDKITREEMATIIANVLTQLLDKKPGEKPEDYLEKYVDNANVANYAKDPVAMVTRYEIFGGRPDGTFAPKDNADRAEASKVIYMLFYLK